MCELGHANRKGWRPFKKQVISVIKKRPLGCRETSGANYPATECHIPEWRRSQLHRYESLKIRINFVHRQLSVVTTSYVYCYSQYVSSSWTAALWIWRNYALPKKKVKVKGHVWGHFGTAACRPIVPLPHWVPLIHLQRRHAPHRHFTRSFASTS